MSSRRARPGRTLSNRPPEGESWTWQTSTMLGSITMRALGVHARRILDFLMHEHARHAGQENGNLAAPYKQLEAWGVTAADVRKGFAELIATGFVEVTYRGLRVAGAGAPSRYRLTWFPTRDGPPSHTWIAVIKRINVQGVGNVAQARAWLKKAAQDGKRGKARKHAATPHLQVVPPITCEAIA